MARMVRAVACVVVLAGALWQSQPFAERWSRVSGFHEQRVQEAGIAGSSLVVVKDGAVVGRGFEGYQDLVAKRRVDEDTIYHCASITKMFTGVAIMQLRDRGLLSLDDPAVKYIPQLREVYNPFGEMSQ